MNSQEPRNPEDRFEEAWKQWLRRPPRLSPAEAADGITKLLPARRRRPKSWMVAAAASLLAGAVGTSIWWSTMVVAPPTAPPVPASAPLGGGEVLIWLDDQTPLYMTFQPEAINPNGGEE